ncbi:hypothetical protein K449DRAFT_380566, partial [Hypoxylon sp. EC38]
MVYCGVVWCGAVWCGAVWCGDERDSDIFVGDWLRIPIPDAELIGAVGAVSAVMMKDL